MGPNRAATAPAEIQPVTDQAHGVRDIDVRLTARRIELPLCARD
jgi:hypothetical protein